MEHGPFIYDFMMVYLLKMVDLPSPQLSSSHCFLRDGAEALDHQISPV